MPKGLVVQGNINLNNRPVVHNADGSVSTELSFSREQDGLEVLVPRVVNGKMLSEDAAWQHYLKTGEHMGKFDSPENADAYAGRVHNRQMQHSGTMYVLPDVPKPIAKGSDMDTDGDVLLRAMRKSGIPLTRNEYLKIAYMGNPPSTLPAEVEEELPQRFRMPEKEVKVAAPKAGASKTAAKPKPRPEPKSGAPTNFPGPVFPNPKGIKPMLDTERPVNPTRLPQGVKFDKSLGGPAQMDISNPESNQMEIPPEQRVQ